MTRREFHLGIWMAAGVLAMAPAALAQASADRLGADNNFAAKAAQGGMAEVKLGQLAQQNGHSQAVKDFGSRMVEDHSKAGDELKSVAGRKNITLPSDVDARDQAIYDRLSKLQGAAFDRAYMRDMVADHKTDVTEFRRESEHGADADLKAFAAKTLPTLEEHLRMAEKTEAAVRTEK